MNSYINFAVINLAGMAALVWVASILEYAKQPFTPTLCICLILSMLYCLLKFKKLDKKYESIIEGDKIFIINLKPNMYKLETIGLPNAKVPDEIEKFVKMYIDIDEIFESLLLNKLKELYSDLKWEFPPLNANVTKFFSFG